MLAQGPAFILGAEEATTLEDRNDLFHSVHFSGLDTLTPRSFRGGGPIVVRRCSLV
jgi:hypothetical protein